MDDYSAKMLIDSVQVMGQDLKKNLELLNDRMDGMGEQMDEMAQDLKDIENSFSALRTDLTRLLR